MSTVTAVVPCHNGGRFLPECLESILDQDGLPEPPEVIVVDDRSSDPETLTALREWATHPRVKVVSSEGPPGPGAARNTGIRHAGGNWIAFLDADDVWLPGALSARFSILKVYPDAAFLSADFAHLHEDGRIDEAFFRTRPGTCKFLQPAFASGKPMRLERPVEPFLDAMLTHTCVLMARRELLTRLGGFDESLRRAQDIHLWLRLAARADMHFTPQVVAYYRQHEGSLTHEEEARRKWSIRGVRKHLDDPLLRPYRGILKESLARYHIENTYYHRARADRLKALQAAIGACRWNPLSTAVWRVLAGTLLGRP